MAYDLARNFKNSSDTADDLQRLKALGQDSRKFPRAEPGIVWALYRTRISS